MQCPAEAARVSMSGVAVAVVTWCRISSVHCAKSSGPQMRWACRARMVHRAAEGSTGSLRGPRACTSAQETECSPEKCRLSSRNLQSGLTWLTGFPAARERSVTSPQACTASVPLLVCCWQTEWLLHRPEQRAAASACLHSRRLRQITEACPHAKLSRGETVPASRRDMIDVQDSCR